MFYLLDLKTPGPKTQEVDLNSDLNLIDGGGVGIEGRVERSDGMQKDFMLKLEFFKANISFDHNLISEERNKCRDEKRMEKL